MTDTPAALRRRRAVLSTLSARSGLPALPALRANTLVVGTLALVLVSSPIAAAQAAEVAQTVVAAQPTIAAQPGEVVELSTDGTSYSRSLPDLFGPVRLTPGDHVDGSFWVRNSGARPARLTLTVTDVDVSDPDTLQALTLTSGPADRPGAVVPLAEVARYATLSAGETLDPGEAIMIVSTLALEDLSGQQGQQSTVDLTVRVTLSGAATDAAPDTAPVPTHVVPGPTGTTSAPPGATPPGSTGGEWLAPSTGGGLLASTWDGRLASTGGIAVTSTVAAGALLALGLILWFAARRRRDHDTQPDGPGAPSTAAKEERA